MTTTIGRRVGGISEVTQPGDYCGPIRGYTSDAEAMFFLLPTASPEEPLHRTMAPDDANGIHHITFPPHTYRECDDGSLEVRASIGALRSDGSPGHVWHGYLDEGHVWRTA